MTNRRVMTKAINTIVVLGTPSFLAYRSTNQTIATATSTKVQCNTESWDSGGQYDAVTNFRFTPLTAGKYMLGAIFVGEGAAAYIFQSSLWKNGAYHRAGFDQAPGHTANTSAAASWLVDANGTTDYFEFYIYQNSGVNKNLIGNGEANTVFWGFRAY